MPPLSQSGRRAWASLFVVAILLVLGISAWAWHSQQPPEVPSWGQVAFVSAGHSGELPEWARPETCAACHTDAHDDWQHSHHFFANRPTNWEDDAEAFQQLGAVKLGGITYRPETYGRKLWLVPENAEWAGEGSPAVAGALPALGVIGYKPLLQYLVPGPGGRWQAHAAAYDPERQEWFDVHDGAMRTVGDWGHWSGQGMNWNANCAWCHMTGYDKGYDIAADAYESIWQAQAISCVQCHPGMEQHVTLARIGDLSGLKHLSTTQHMDNCASCHSRREELTPNRFTAGDRYEDHFRLALADQPEVYFADGQARDEDFVYASFHYSKMGHAGLSCLDCHQPHHGGTLLPVDNNALCLSCHGSGTKGATIITEREHTHHASGSTGNLCINCHMPQRTYMARDPRRDHGFTSPDPTLTRELGIPNACSSCHTDESLEWAEQWADTWYGTTRRLHERARAHAIATAEQGDPQAVPQLQALIEAEENPYWRATYLGWLAQFGPAAKTFELARTAKTAQLPLERTKAIEALATSPRTLPEIAPLLHDPTRLVRLTAAQAWLGAGQALPAANQPEYEAYLRTNADRPVGLFRWAQWLQAQGSEPAEVVPLYERAAKLDNYSPRVAYNVAVALDGLGRPPQARAILERSRSLYPRDGLPSYGLGLLVAAGERPQEAIRYFAEAVESAGDQAPSRWYYNLVVACMQQEQPEAAREWLAKARALHPHAPELQQLEAYLAQ
ncbi:MAG: multiheme c-type cytochrome [Verrucomicrobiota bacterium JB022]|nr:multiheme c-type cytochrome [Verrucomicrobiota bacterium JB022]